MIVDIYIQERNGSREIRIPWLPESIEYKPGSAVEASYKIMNLGEVAVQTGTGLASFSWSGTFPGELRSDNAMLRGDWIKPDTYHYILNYWLQNHTKLNLLVTGYPINADVRLQSYESEASGAFGDIHYKVKFVEDRALTIFAEVLESASGNDVETAIAGADEETLRASDLDNVTTYTVKYGDTLWSIAQTYLGSGARYLELYEANAEILDTTARRYGYASSNHGNYLWAGITLSIPR